MADMSNLAFVQGQLFARVRTAASVRRHKR